MKNRLKIKTPRLLQRLFSSTAPANGGKAGPDKENSKYLIPALLAFIPLCLGTLMLGNSFYFSEDNVSSFWPTSGLVVAYLILCRGRIWPLIFAMLIVTQFISELTIANRPLNLVLLFLIPICVESFIAAYLLRRVIGVKIAIWDNSHFLYFFVISVFIATLAGSVLGASIVGILYPGVPLWQVWQVWWFADGIGVLLVAPPILAWAEYKRLAPDRFSMLRETGSELLFWILGLAGAITVVFIADVVEIVGIFDYPYIVIPFYIWVAVRFDLRVVATGLLVTGLLLTWHSVGNAGPFTAGELSPQDTVLSLQAFLFVTTVTIIILSNVVELGKRRTNDLEENMRILVEAERVASIGHLTRSFGGEKIISCSAQVGAIFGITHDEMLERSTELSGFLELVAPADRVDVESALRAFHTTKPDDQKKIKPLDLEYQIRKPGGEYIYVRERASLMPDGDGLNLRSVGTIQDVTELRHASEQLRQSQKMEAVGQLTGGIAHDFNNILGIISGNLSFLKRELAHDEKALKRVETADKAAQRAADLTLQLLGYSRKRAQRILPIDINQVIRSMDSLISRSITPEVEVEHHFTAELWRTEIDSADFEDALLNLVLNARDAMPGGGHLTIETSNKVLDANYARVNLNVTPGDYVVITLSDTGNGISKEHLERVFEPFFTTKPRGKGTGLGLSMVFGFIQRSKGHIKIYSEPGSGTTIYCYLPRSTSNDEGQKSPIAVASLPLRGQETVLVVEDEEDLLSLAQQFLEILGYTVVTAAAGQQALKVLAERPGIDLLFSDVVMPGGMNGYELAEHATALYPGLKVLLTSGYTSKILSRNGHALFETDLLHKPYNQDEFARQVRLVLDE